MTSAIPGVTREGFAGTVAPAEVRALVHSMLVSGAPFSHPATDHRGIGRVPGREPVRLVLAERARTTAHD